MRELAEWPPRRIVVACLLWFLGAPAVAAIGLMIGGVILAVFSGGQRFSFSISINNWTAAWLFIPPLALVTAWLWSRRAA